MVVTEREGHRDGERRRIRCPQFEEIKHLSICVSRTNRIAYLTPAMIDRSCCIEARFCNSRLFLMGAQWGRVLSAREEERPTALSIYIYIHIYIGQWRRATSTDRVQTLLSRRRRVIVRNFCSFFFLFFFSCLSVEEQREKRRSMLERDYSSSAAVYN